MKKKIYLIQPTYRKMDGNLVKGHTQFNHSLNLSILSASIPEDWEKEICLEYFSDVNYSTDATVVCISCMGYDIMHAFDIAKMFRKEGKIVIFGSHMDDWSEKIMLKVCNSVFSGYPNPDMFENILNDVLSNGIKNNYSSDNNLNFNFDYKVFNNLKIRQMQMLSSAGCLNNCDYCCTAGRFNGKYRLRKARYVIEDMKAVREMVKIGSFVDSNFYNNRDYTIKLCREIIKEKINMDWGAQSTIDIGNDTETLYFLRKSGCRMLFIGLETLNQNNLNQINKKFNTSDYLRLISNIRNAGIHVAGYFMVGFDYDSKTTFKIIYDFINRSKISFPLINILLPVPGTVTFYKLQSESRTVIKNEFEFMKMSPLYSVPCNKSYFIPKNFTSDELEDGYMKLYKELSTYKNIIKRSLAYNMYEFFNLLILNYGIKKEYKAMLNYQTTKIRL